MNLNEDCIKMVFSYLYNVYTDCVTKVYDLKEYSKSIMLCKKLTFLKKKCGLIFFYVPESYTRLPSLYECGLHCDKYSNKIPLINTLNRFRKDLYDNKDVKEIKFNTEKECNICLPYLKQYCRVAYISDSKKCVFMMTKTQRYPGLIV